MRIDKKNSIIITSIGIIAVLAIIIVAQKLYPVAIVRGTVITQSDWLTVQSVAAKFEPNFSRTNTFEQLIKIEQEKQLAGKVDLAAEIRFLKAEKVDEYNELLDKYFSGNAGLFEQFVVAPRTYDGKLRMRYNSDYKANERAYQRTQNILADLKSGKDFTVLAQTQSDDKITGQLGGDLGFVHLDQLLPEIVDAVKTMPLAQVSDEIIISRFGYHILYPVETAQKDGQTVYHIKQILISTSGYEDWLNAQLQKISVWRIVRP